MIDLINIKLNYGKNTIIENLSLSFEQSKIHGIVGLNGAGKTTLFNAISGHKKLNAGSIRIEEKTIKKQDFSFLETHNYFYPKINAREYMRLFSSGNSSFNLDDWNQIFNLPLRQMIDNYSTGMKKKLAFLALVAQDRKYLVLDEPFNGLDLESVQNLKSILHEFRNQGKTILISSHILESLTNLCDTISYLHQGKIAFTYQKKDFHNIEKEIFGAHKENINEQISLLLGKNKQEYRAH